jgi:lipopolysaccharide cholinephosphotransferase
MKELQKKYDYDNSDLIVDHDDGVKGIMLKSVIGEPTLVEFEGHQLYGVADAHTYLSNKYGDYMVIPSENRQRQHNFHYLDFDKSYKTLQT